MQKYLFGLGAMLVGAGLMFVLMHGEELSVVSELAGHSSIITTQRYAHLSPEAKRKAISSLNGFNLASIK